MFNNIYLNFILEWRFDPQGREALSMVETSTRPVDLRWRRWGNIEEDDYRLKKQLIEVD